MTQYRPIGVARYIIEELDRINFSVSEMRKKPDVSAIDLVDSYGKDLADILESLSPLAVNMSRIQEITSEQDIIAVEEHLKTTMYMVMGLCMLRTSAIEDIQNKIQNIIDDDDKKFIFFRRINKASRQELHDFILNSGKIRVAFSETMLLYRNLIDDFKNRIDEIILNVRRNNG